MHISLFIPCFVDMCYPKAAISIVQILEKLGHTIDFPEELACCGQPAFNSGYWDETRTVAVKVLDRLKDSDVVVIASGSCGAMIKNFYPEIFKGTPQEEDANILSGKIYEFTDFLVSKLGVTDLGAKFPARVTYHGGCHGLRELGLREQPRKLLEHVAGLELVEMNDVETESQRKVTVTEKNIRKYKELFEQHQTSVRGYCRNYGMGCTQAPGTVPFDDLVLKMMRQSGQVG